ncbi:phage tail tube protein [Kineothrix sedimenti]|uniref:Tail tube protein n=1 Tax=Kineothrix sedimenti TaxID=3123317 RepID=A0ABZ3ESC9_9FIRM
MAENRVNMVSMLDIGKLMGGETSNIAELGDGFTELSEDWGPDIESTQYINMKSKASTLKGYEFSTTAERQYLNDDMQTVIDNLFKTLPVGSDCETHYYRFYKTDITGSTGDCIRIPVIVAPSSTGGAGGDILTSSIQINGNGDVEQGTVTIGEDGQYTWAKKVTTP